MSERSPERYTPPILTYLFRFLGGLHLIVAIIGVVLMLVVRSHQALGFVSVFSLPAIIGGLLGAIIFYGFAQVIDYLGRTAFASTRIMEMLNASEAPAELQAIRMRLNSTAPFSIAEYVADNNGSVNYQYLNSEGVAEGPFTLSDLLSFRETGLIADETLVLRDGDAEWRQCREILGTS